MWRTLAPVMLVVLVACGGGAPPVPASSPEAEPVPAPVPEPEPARPPEVGSVTGVVRLRGERPEPVRINVSSDAYFDGQNPDGVFDPAFAVNDDGTVPHVVLWMQAPAVDEAQWPVPEEPARLVVDRRANFFPHALVVRAGQPVELRNDAMT